MYKKACKIASVFVSALLIFDLLGNINYTYASTQSSKKGYSIKEVTRKKESQSVKSMGYIPYKVKITKANTRPSTYVKAAEALPSSYNLRQKGLVTSVKDQGQIGDCWAFAAVGSIESNFLRTTGKTYDFSEINMATHNGIQDDADNGGNNEIATSYLANWSGVVNESDDPYPNPADPSNVVVRNGIKVKKHVQDVIFIPDRTSSTDNNEIKQAVMNYGAISTSLYMDKDQYLNSNGAYYDNSDTDNDHQVDIVGWDDSYSKSNFKVAPSGDGAFICKNSWGTSFGNQGYFYVSYYDVSVGKDNAVFNGVENFNNYSNNYQYDKDYEETLDYGGQGNWFSNVFTANSNTSNKESLAAISFYTDKENTAYEIYEDSNYDTNKFTKITSNKVASGTISMPGYHTIKLNQAIPLTAGTNFAIAVKLVGSTIPLSPGGNNASKSFVSSDGVNWRNPSYNSTGLNVCLKAFTNVKYQTPVTAISLNNSSINLTTSNTSTTSATSKVVASVSPSNANDKNVVFESSDSSIATVDDNGNVKAVSPGTATINATSEDGSFTATANVSVQAVKITFGDVNLEKAVRQALNKTSGDITDSDMKNLTQLDSENSSIRNLSGLEYAVNLSDLNLAGNKITSIGPLKNLNSLQNLDLSNNSVSDITAIQGLSNLQSLYLENNNIDSINSISNLTSLADINFDDNNISDVSPVEKLTHLNSISIQNNELADIQPIVDNINNLNGRFQGDIDVNIGSNYLDLTSETNAYRENQTLSSSGITYNSDNQNTGAIIENSGIKDDLINIPVYGSMIVVFKNNISKGSDFNTISVSDSDADSVNVSASISGNKLIIKPNSALKTSHSYFVTLPENAVIDSDNKKLEGNNQNLSFQTLSYSCDVNNDSTVDIKDLATEAKNYNSNWNNTVWNANLDLNDDGVVDMYDIAGISKAIK